MANVGSYPEGGYLSTNQSVEIGFGRCSQAYHTISYVREEVGGGHLATRAGASVGAIGRVAAGGCRAGSRTAGLRTLVRWDSNGQGILAREGLLVEDIVRARRVRVVHELVAGGEDDEAVRIACRWVVLRGMSRYR